MQLQTYSRIVAWLKVILPLTALALLSTLFLIARGVEPTAMVPLSAIEIESRLRDQQITAANYSGTTPRGEQISISAETLRASRGAGEAHQVGELTGTMDLRSGDQISLSAERGAVDLDADSVTFEDRVIISSTQGYIVTSDHLRTTLSFLEAETDTPVTASGPIGQIDAGKMRLTTTADGGPIQMLFTDGVKLIYTPKQTED